MPKISVVIPVYGVEKYIERCARSLFEQTLEDIEYLFVDDCTKDRSIEVLNKVLEDYPLRKTQVVVHRMEHNSGQAKVREWGMRHASGEFITHCDSDDWVEKDMYQQMYSYAIQSSSDIVVTDFYVDKNESSIHNAGLILDKNSLMTNFLLRRNKCILWNKLFRSNLFEDDLFIYPEGDMGEDMAIILQCLLNTKNVGYVDRAFYHYCINENSITQTSSPEKVYRRYCQLRDNVDLIISVYKSRRIYDSYRQEFISLKFHVKQQIEHMIKDSAMFRIWKNTYADINISLLFCPFIKIKVKLVYIVKSILFKFY